MLRRIFDLFRRRSSEPAVARTEDIETLRRGAEAALSHLRRTLEDLSSEMDYIPAEAKTGAVRLLDQAKQQLPHLE